MEPEEERVDRPNGRVVDLEVRQVPDAAPAGDEFDPTWDMASMRDVAALLEDAGVGSGEEGSK